MQTETKYIPFSPPSISESEIAEVVDTLRSDWITTGPKTKEFEASFVEKFNYSGALALNSCTAGLHASLVALGVGHGDEVITTPMTFCASVNVIEHVGARPVLIDVEADTLNLDIKRIESAMTPATRAILPVHYAGHPVELDTLNGLARAHQVAVVEDAAHAITARYKGNYIGTFGNPTAFSFYATKNLTTGEGGMLVGHPEFLERARMLSLHGMNKDAWKRYDREGSWYYEVEAPGFKYNMTDIQASIGLAQLRRLDDFQQRRREIVARYHAAFSLHEAFELPVERTDVTHAWHLYVLRLNEKVLRIGRDEFVQRLGERNIGVSVHFIPIHLHPFYQRKYDYMPQDFPIAFDAYRRMFSLPLHPRLSDEDVSFIIEAVLDIAAKNTR